MTTQPAVTSTRRRVTKSRLKLQAIVTVEYVPLPPEKYAEYRRALAWLYRDRSKDNQA